MRLWLTFAAVAAGALADLQCVPPDDVTHLCWPGRQSGLFAVQHSRKHGSTVEILRFAQRTAAFGPRITSRLQAHSPMRDVAPSFCFRPRDAAVV